MEYANKFVAFQEALDQYTQALKTFHASRPTENERELVHAARIKVLQLYNKELTTVQKFMNNLFAAKDSKEAARLYGRISTLFDRFTTEELDEIITIVGIEPADNRGDKIEQIVRQLIR